MTAITYTKQGDYLLPNLLPPQEPQIPLTGAEEEIADKVQEPGGGRE